MCGICGVASATPGAPALSPLALRAMTDVIEHRGPDEEGSHREPGVALGMRRLSIIDVAGSHQPVANEDGTVRAVFNGEIYNFPDLRRELLASGHRLATAGDGETVVHLYEQHGLRFVERLRGMFAIALWDRRRRRLVLARDRMGVKPLYWATGPYGLAFASEVKSLLAGGLVAPALDPLGAELFLAHGFVPGPWTLFAGVRKLPPASMLVWEHGRLAGERTWWGPWDGPAGRPRKSWAEDTEELLELVRRAVHARMISDVPLGVMLSGGLDSSLITALMAEHADRPVQTFSIGFAEDADANELGDARRVADRLGTDHHELTTSATDHPELLDEALWHVEEPIADISQLGMLLLSRLARRSVTVALSGQGADELLAGYRKHDVAFAAGKLAQMAPARSAAARAAGMFGAGSTPARGLTAASTRDPVARLLASSRVVQPHERAALLATGFARRDAEWAIAQAVAQHVPVMEEAARRGVALSPLGQALFLDSRLALVDNMLLYFDKASMAASLEVRVPFMDHDVVAFCMGLPDGRRIWRRRRKELLRRAARGLVDDAIIDKPKRGFFHPALNAWLGVHRDALITESLLDGRAARREQYDSTAVRALVQVAGAGGKKPAQRLFSLLLLERWQRLFVDADGPGAAVASRGRRTAAA